MLLVHRLGPAQADAARRALAAGHDVACLTLDPAVAAELGARVRVLGEDALPGFEASALGDSPLDLVERTSKELLRRSPRLARSLAAITRTDELDRYVSRALLRDAGAFLGLLGLAADGELAAYDRVDIERHWPNGPHHALLARVTRAHAMPLPPMQARRLGTLRFQAEEVPRPLAALRALAHALRALASLWGDGFRLLSLAACPLPQRPFLIRTYIADWGFDRGGHRRLRNVDFVVDDETIQREEVAVWKDGPLNADDEAGLYERGYAVLSQEDVQVGLLGFLTRVLPGLLRAVPVFLYAVAAERWWTHAARRLLASTLLWGEVARQVRPRVLFTVNDLQEDGVARTFVLRRFGCLTIEYEFSSHWLTDERGWIPDYVYAFTVRDVMVSWGPLHTEHFGKHRGSIREFWQVGCLWSEHARLVRDEPGLAYRYRAELSRLGADLEAWEAVVAVFDTSTASFFTADDMVAFYAGIAALARRLPRVLFLCKPKRAVAEVFAAGADGSEVAAALAAAPNVVVLPRDFETAAVVGVSGLSINACFTSPAVESVGLGLPALYFDPTGLFPESFFRRIPRLVAVSEDELATLVEEQLELRGDVLADDLRARFDELEGHFDGLALTRLRKRLRAVLDA